MSLDVSLRGPSRDGSCTCQCGNVHAAAADTELYSSNITHNLGGMAKAAGIYEVLWRPADVGFDRAKQLIPYLEKGLADLIAKPMVYRRLNAPNGWGMYEHFVPFVKQYLEACRRYPDATVEVST